MKSRGITVYKVRLVENIFEGHVAEFTLNGRMAVGRIRELLKLDNQARFFQNGKELKDNQTPKEGSLTIKLVPGAFSTAVAVISVVVAISAVVIGIVALSNLNNTKFPNLSKTNASLRGSTNTARKSERLPILLGRHRVYPDVAALPFSSYQDHNQYLHQLFCFGYGDVAIDYSNLKIGETLISYYEDCTYNAGLGNIYPSRVVENVYQLQLKNDGSCSPIVRSTASACRKIEVGLMAPNGIYRYKGENREGISVGIRIEWRVPGGTWSVAHEETLDLNTDKWRKMYSITPSGNTEGIYEVRVSRTTKEADELQVSDSLYLDVIKSFVGLDEESSLPVTSDNLQLVSLKTKATDQLNGVIDGFNAICTLKTRAWDGLGSGPSHWITQETRNPASAILYLLTNPNANAEPVEDSLIDWESFEGFYRFCEDYGFNCDAWVTTEYTVLQLCEFIAASNMAEMVIQCDRISIRAEKAQESVVQLFTPRNAWDFEMIRSFESKPKNITVNFDDASKGYVQVERKVALNESGSIVFDSEVDGESLTIDSFGVTSALQAARLGAQKLKLLYSQTRTYSWKSDIEGIVCLPGDVVLIENDNFLLGLGEGRIKKIIYNDDSKISAIKLDARMKMVSGSSYGVRIRTSSAILDSLPVVNATGEDWTLTFQTPQEISIGIDIGDLVAFGEFKTESHKVLITDISPDQNRSCSFKGVDYSDDAYSQELTIPAYDSGLSKYPDDGGSIGASSSTSVPRYEICGTQGKDGASVEIQYSLGRSMNTPPLEDSQCYWNTVAMYWGSSKIVWRDWTEAVPVPKDGEYLWMRVKVGDGPWRYSRLTGEHGVDGQDVKVFSIGCDHTAVERNDRLEGVVAYKFTILVQGYENANPQLTVNGENMTDEMEFDEDTGAFFYLFIMAKRKAKPITAILYDGTVEMDRIELQVVDSTMQEAYIGVRDEAPSRFDETQSLLKGDWYVLKSTNVLYIWNGNSWEEKAVDSTGDFSYLSKVSIAMTDMIKLGTTDKTTATILGVYRYLVAEMAFINMLFSKSITLLEDGEIKSENYDSDAPSSSRQFILKSNGYSEFWKTIIFDAYINGSISSNGFRTTKSSEANTAIALSPAPSRYGIPMVHNDKSLVDVAKSGTYDPSGYWVNTNPVVMIAGEILAGIAFFPGSGERFFMGEGSLNGNRFLVIEQCSYSSEVSHLSRDYTDVSNSKTSYSRTFPSTLISRMEDPSTGFEFLSSDNLDCVEFKRSDLSVENGVFECNGSGENGLAASVVLANGIERKIYAGESCEVVINDERISFIENGKQNTIPFDGVYRDGAFLSFVIHGLSDGIAAKNIMPYDSGDYDIGSDTRRFNRLYLNENIYAKNLFDGVVDSGKAKVQVKSTTGETWDTYVYYRKWQRGFVEQWGRIHKVNASFINPNPIRFVPFAFPFHCENVQITRSYSYSNPSGVQNIGKGIEIVVTSTTSVRDEDGVWGFDVAQSDDSGRNNNVDRPFSWYAFGQAKSS
nr:MAG TPA: tail protein [Bacteriophage sp.]